MKRNFIKHNALNEWKTPWFSNRWFYILAAGLGLLIAIFIITDNLMFAMGLVLLVPAVILFTNYPFLIFVLWILATPFLQNTITDQGRTIYWVVYRALPPLAVCIILITNRLRKDRDRKHFKLGLDGLVMVVFIGWTLLNVFVYHPSANLSYLYSLYDQFFVPFCIFWWIRFIAPNKQDLERMLPAVFFLLIFEVGVGIVSWLWPAVLPQEWVGTASDRTIGTLRFVHAFSLTLIFCTLLLFHAAMNRRSNNARVILLIASGIGFAGVFLSFSRGAWLGGVAVWLGLLYLYPKTIFRLTVIVLVIMAILGGTILSRQIAFASERLSSEQTAMVRFVIWDAGIQMIKLKPLLGWGFGDYRLYAGQFQRILYNTAATKQQASHNTFISLAAEVGIPGLLLYFLPALWLLIRSFKSWPNLPANGFWSRKLLVCLWLLPLAYCIVIFFSDIRTSTYGLSLWWISLGWIALLVEPFHAHRRQYDLATSPHKFAMRSD